VARWGVIYNELVHQVVVSDLAPVIGPGFEVVPLPDEVGENWVYQAGDFFRPEWVEAPVLVDLAGRKAEKIAAIEEAREASIGGGVTYNGAVFDSDARTREILLGYLAYLGLGNELPAGFKFRDRDNVDHDFTAADLQALSGAMVLLGTQAYYWSWVKKAAVRAAITVEELDAVDLSGAPQGVE
jgi:hypothetical protein